MHIFRDSGGELKTFLSDEALPEIGEVWHGRRVDVLSLDMGKGLRFNVNEVLLEGHPAIAKLAHSENYIRQMENETVAYWHLTENQDPDNPRRAQIPRPPNQNGRIMGYLLEKLEGARAGPDDLPQCEELLRRVHTIGLVHGDVNRHNFIVDRVGGKRVRLVDFECAYDFDD